MKCVILAAGFATRLYPLTKDKPKALLPVNGKPILEYITKELEPYVDEIYIISNNKLFNNFNEWLNNYKSRIRITLVNDNTNTNEERLGALGDLKFFLDRFNVNEDIMVVAGDNLFNFNIHDFIDFFKSNGTCVALYDVKYIELARHYGITTLNGNKIKDFHEKPHNPRSTLASTGIYFISKNDLNILHRYCEIGNLEALGYFIHYLARIKDLYGFIINGEWHDIGTNSEYRKVRKSWRY